MAKEHRFTVTGRGGFPLDMLRYDACHPTDGDSVEAIHASLDPRARRDFPNGHRVNLRSAIGAATAGRWASFGWHVEK